MGMMKKEMSSLWTSSSEMPMTMMRRMSLIQNLNSGRFEFLSLLIGTNVYVYYLVLRLGRGRARLVALMALLPAFVIVPWRGPTACERVLESFLFHWMITSKLLLLVWDSGPAADPVALSSFPRFFSAMTFSLHMKRIDERPQLHHSSINSKPNEIVKEKDGQDGQDGQKEADGDRATAGGVSDGGLVRRKSQSLRDVQNEDGGLRARAGAAAAIDSELMEKGKHDDKGHDRKVSWVTNVVNSQAWYMVGLRAIFYFIVSASMVRVLLAWKPLPVMDEYVLNLLYGLLVYFACLFVFESAAAVPACVLGVRLEPNFNMPFVADSLGDFWGRRWNLLVNNLLRVSVYEPIVSTLERGGGERKISKSKRQMDRAISSFAVFLVSGIMHEIIFFYMLQTPPTWEMTAFFVVNGLATIAEGFIKKSGLVIFELPRPVKRLYTIGFVYLTGYWLFIPRLDRHGHLDRSLEELGRLVDWIQGLIMFGPRSLLHWTTTTL